MNVFRACTVGLVATVALCLACPLRADEARIQALRQKIDAADVQIGRVTRALSSASGQQAIQELNRQLKQYEKERSYDVFALYRAQEADRASAREKARLQADLAAFKGAVTDLVAEVSRYAGALASHNSDGRAQNQAVRHFNSLPDGQRPQAEADRLNRWGAQVNTRLRNLVAWQARLKARASQLKGWEGRLTARGVVVR